MRSVMATYSLWQNGWRGANRGTVAGCYPLPANWRNLVPPWYWLLFWESCNRATRHILEREFSVFGKAEYEELSGISVSHIYNLRRSKTYLRYRVRVQHTQRSQVSIAERRNPDPQGKPGYLRVDTVHQGQHDGQPGLYHLNAVDTVTQWEIVGCVE